MFCWQSLRCCLLSFCMIFVIIHVPLELLDQVLLYPINIYHFLRLINLFQHLLQTVWQNGFVDWGLLDLLHSFNTITACSNARLLWYHQIDSIGFWDHFINIVLLTLIWTVYAVIFIVRVLQDWFLKRSLVRTDRLLLCRPFAAYLLSILRSMLPATSLYFADPRHKLLFFLLADQLLGDLLTDLLRLNSIRRSIVASRHLTHRLAVIH